MAKILLALAEENVLGLSLWVLGLTRMSKIAWQEFVEQMEQSFSPSMMALENALLLQIVRH